MSTLMCISWTRAGAVENRAGDVGQILFDWPAIRRPPGIALRTNSLGSSMSASVATSGRFANTANVYFPPFFTVRKRPKADIHLPRASLRRGPPNRPFVAATMLEGRPMSASRTSLPFASLAKRPSLHSSHGPSKLTTLPFLISSMHWCRMHGTRCVLAF